MRASFLLATPLLVVLQSGPGPVPGVPAAPAPAEEPAASAPDPELVARVAEFLVQEPGLAAGLGRLERWSDEGEVEAARLLGEALLMPDPLSSWRRRIAAGDSRTARLALELVEPALDWLGLGGRTREERAHVHFAIGVLEARAGDAPAAAEAFEAARASAGPGELRRDSIHDLGTLELLEGEAWRARIPELGGGAPPAPPAGGAADGEEPPDPLEEARRHYLAAREHFVEGLRLDPGLADLRGNCELALRRLRELEELERRRQEEEQQQDQQDQEERDDQQQDESPEESQQQDPGQDESSEEPPQDPEPQEPEDGAEPEDPEQDQAEREENETQDQQDESETPPEPREERYLTREEVQRLLDRLEEHERQGEELRERMRQSRRRPSPRDW